MKNEPKCFARMQKFYTLLVNLIPYGKTTDRAYILHSRREFIPRIERNKMFMEELSQSLTTTPSVTLQLFDFCQPKLKCTEFSLAVFRCYFIEYSAKTFLPND